MIGEAAQISDSRLAEGGNMGDADELSRDQQSRTKGFGEQRKRRPTGILVGVKVNKVVTEVEDRERAKASAHDRTEAEPP